MSNREAVRYFYDVESRIFDQWELPADVEPDNSVKVRFILAESGHVSSAEVVQSSDPALNESVLAAIHRAEPFPEMSHQAKCLDGQPLFGTFRNPTAAR